MAEIPFAGNPFQYHPRWISLDVSEGITKKVKYVLEERDRELEDYLGKLASQGTVGEQPSISVSRATNYVAAGAVATEAVNFNVTDWADTGAHFAVVAGKGSIVFDQKGRWWVTAFLEITDSSDGVTYPYLAWGRVGYLRIVHGTVAFSPNNVGNIAGGFVIDVLAGDYIQAGGQFFGGVSPGFTAAATALRPSLLQAFLLKKT